MLRHRIITAIVLITLLLGSLLSGKLLLISLFLGVFVSIAAWEWAGLVRPGPAHNRLLYAAALSLTLPFLHAAISSSWVLVVILIGAAAWCLAAVCVFIYQKEGRFLPDGLPAGYVTGIIVLIPSWTGLVWLYAQLRGLHLTLLFFITVALMDSAAYIGGRRWGKTRLASRVSPGKTREGFYAGMVGALIPVVVYVVYERLSLLTSVSLVLLCLVCAGFSVVGDLFVSMFKRHANVKDSGKLLPGHGGVLDRVDGITAATPVFAAGIWMLEGRL